MSLQESQQTTFAPWRWRHQVYSGVIQRDRTAADSLSNPSMPAQRSPSSTENQLRHTVPIPGGRYLILFAEERDIEIYDLGVSGRTALISEAPILRLEGEKRSWNFVVATLGDTTV